VLSLDIERSRFAASRRRARASRGAGPDHGSEADLAIGETRLVAKERSGAGRRAGGEALLADPRPIGKAFAWRWRRLDFDASLAGAFAALSGRSRGREGSSPPGAVTSPRKGGVALGAENAGRPRRHRGRAHRQAGTCRAPRHGASFWLKGVRSAATRFRASRPDFPDKSAVRGSSTAAWLRAPLPDGAAASVVRAEQGSRPRAVRAGEARRLREPPRMEKRFSRGAGRIRLAETVDAGGLRNAAGSSSRSSCAPSGNPGRAGRGGIEPGPRGRLGLRIGESGGTASRPCAACAATWRLASRGSHGAGVVKPAGRCDAGR